MNPRSALKRGEPPRGGLPVRFHVGHAERVGRLWFTLYNGRYVVRYCDNHADPDAPSARWYIHVVDYIIPAEPRW